MGKIKDNFLKGLKAYLITGIIASVLGVVIFCLFYFLKNRTLFDAINASTLTFVILISIGGLMAVGHYGMFDGIAYGFRQLFTSAFSKKANKLNDFPGYVQQKRIVREHSPIIGLSFVAVSLVFLIVLIILEIIYHQ